MARCLELPQQQHGEVEINRPAASKERSLLVIPSCEENQTSKGRIDVEEGRCKGPAWIEVVKKDWTINRMMKREVASTP